jgi:hypothetical protein
MPEYEFPDDSCLVRYLALLRRVLLDARARTYVTDQQTAELLDAVENVPDLLARWRDMKEEYIVDDLRRYEAKYLGGDGRYSKLLCEGPADSWQDRWQDRTDHS